MITVLRAVGLMLLVAAIVITFSILVGPTALVKPISAVVIITALGDCVIWGLMYRVYRRHRDLVLLREDLARHAVTTFAAILLGLVGAIQFLPPGTVPKGVASGLLLLTILMLSIAPLFRLITYYRGG